MLCGGHIDVIHDCIDIAVIFIGCSLHFYDAVGGLGSDQRTNCEWIHVLCFVGGGMFSLVATYYTVQHLCSVHRPTHSILRVVSSVKGPIYVGLTRWISDDHPDRHYLTSTAY